MSTVAVHQLARALNRTEQNVLDVLDAIGFTARNGETQVPVAVAKLAEARIRKREAGTPTTTGSADLVHDSPQSSAGEWLGLVGPDGADHAVLVRYSAEESGHVLENLTRTELAHGRELHGGNVGAAVVDHLSKASPFVLAGLQAGQVFKVIGTPALLRGLKDGSMSLMSTAEGALGTVLKKTSGKIAGQLRFAQASLVPVTAPLLAIQVFQAIAGTAQLSRINARLDMVQRSLERANVRQEAATLGQARHGLRVLDDILDERRNTGTFSADMLMRLARVEESIGSLVERNRVLVEDLRRRAQSATKLSGKAGAVQASIFLKEEGSQAAHDMRLLVALMMADLRVLEARLRYALEHAPGDVERRLESIRKKTIEYRSVMESLPVLDDVKQHARACVAEMAWWERHITARGVPEDVHGLDSFPPSDITRHTPGTSGEAQHSYIFWQDPNGQIHVKLLEEGNDGTHR